MSQRRNIFSPVIRSEREDERGLPKGRSINLDFSEKGNQNVWWAHPSYHAGHISTRGTFHIKGLRARPRVVCHLRQQTSPSSFCSSLVVYIYMDGNKIDVTFWIDCRQSSKSNFGQGPVIVHSSVNRRHQRKVEIDLQGSDRR
ncbi:hypothetical protein CDAR_184381 [Caerostris darwini]|uniref:Uncharacterized protein n=1 Tax=Caerostris darwini TaxID=1538125 RepID=A0AAV4UFW4_9ARAC|nr:hypothetical protein CDAR_184381 [Caerostris darwini]